MTDVQLNAGDNITVRFLGDDEPVNHAATVVSSNAFHFALKFDDGEIIEYSWLETRNMEIRKQETQLELALDPTSNLMLEVVELRAEVARLRAQNRKLLDRIVEYKRAVGDELI